MLRDDVIILTAIEDHSERSTRFTQAAFICLGRNLLSGYDYVIRVALITISHVSLITSFQPPLAK